MSFLWFQSKAEKLQREANVEVILMNANAQPKEVIEQLKRGK